MSPLADAARLKGDTKDAELTYARAIAAFQRAVTGGASRPRTRTWRSSPTNAATTTAPPRCSSTACGFATLWATTPAQRILEGLAASALATEGTSDAVILLAASSMLRAATGATALPEDREVVDQLVVQGKRRLNRAAFQEAWAAGERLDSGNLVSFVAGRWEFQNSGPAPDESER